jgi:hypothetical protein
MAPQVNDDSQPGARLYTREDESVRVVAHEDGGVWAVSIVGPGGEDRVRVFHEQAAFEAFCAEHDRALLTKGFRPRVSAERRGDDSDPLSTDSYPAGRRR